MSHTLLVKALLSSSRSSTREKQLRELLGAGSHEQQTEEETEREEGTPHGEEKRRAITTSDGFSLRQIPGGGEEEQGKSACSTPKQDSTMKNGSSQGNFNLQRRGRRRN